MEWLKQFARLFGWKNAQFETLTEINVSGMKIRIWGSHTTLDAALSFDHEDFSRRIELLASDYTSREKLYRRLMQIKNVACVAIVNDRGNGVSVYPDWH